MQSIFFPTRSIYNNYAEHLLPYQEYICNVVANVKLHVLFIVLYSRKHDGSLPVHVPLASQVRMLFPYST